jgi:hypothetical protein
MQNLNKLPPIVGVTGRKFNGKDTIAIYLKEKYGYEMLAFAKTLKDICEIGFGFTDEQLYGSQKEVPDEKWYGLTPRQILQFVGTNLFRDHMSELSPNFGQDFWLICVQNKIKCLCEQNNNACIVISDVRFPNEIDMIRKMGGVIIRVKRPEMYNVNDADVHISEKLIDQLDVDVEVINDKTKNDLYTLIDDLIKNGKFRSKYIEYI